MKKIFKHKDYILLLTTITIIFFIFLKIQNLYPFGNTYINRSDSFQQYQPLLYNYLTKIRLHMLEPYSFNFILGSPTAFNYIYYQASPLNLLALLFKKVENMFLFLTLLKLLLTGIFAKIYFNKKTNNNFVSSISSLAYCFSGWFLVYYDQNIWLDVFMVFPLFQYGLEKLLEEKKPYIYIFSLAYMIICNFYIAFIVCVYTLIYFFINQLTKKDKYVNRIKSFWFIALSTIVTILLCAFHIYLTYTSFLKRGIVPNYDIWLYKMNAFNFIGSLFPGQTILLIVNEGTSIPNICTSLIVLISLLYYFINSNIKIKDKIKTVLLLALLTFIIFSIKANYIINCFHIPNGFNYRYSFIISFILINIAIKNFNNLDNKYVLKTSIISVILLPVIILLWHFKYLNNEAFILNICFILIYNVISILLDKNKYQKVFLYVCLSLELLLSFIISYKTNMTSSLDAYKINNYNINDFTTKEYRSFDVLQEYDTYLNENMLDAHTSMPYKKSIYLLKDFGFSTNLISGLYSIKTNTIDEMIFNIKNDNYYLNKIYAVNNDLLNQKSSKNAVDKQNNFIFNATGIENILELQEYKNIDNNSYQYTIKEDSEYTLLLLNEYDKIEINNVITNDLVFNGSITSYYLHKGDTVKITTEVSKSHPITMYKLNKEKLDNAYEKLKQHQIEYTHYSDSKIEGTIIVDNNQFIFTTIPHDDDWHVYVDGKETKTTEIFNGLLAFPCSKGKHSIKLEFKPNYTIPIIISIITFISLIISIFITKKKNNQS